MFPKYSARIGVEVSLKEAEDILDGISVQCSDIVADTLDFRYDGNSLTVKGVDTSLGFTETGLDQFGRFLGVKAHFFKMLKPETRKAVFDDVLVDAHDIMKDSKVRLFDTNVRAVLGAHYTPISGKMLIRELRDSGFEEKSLSLRVFADYESTDLVVLGKEEICCAQDKRYVPGLILRNDDVGRESASISCFLASNGVVGKSHGIIFGDASKSKFSYNHTKRIESRVCEGIKLSVNKMVDWFANAGELINTLIETEALEKERLLHVLKSSAIRDKESEALFTIGNLLKDSYSVWDLIETVSIYASNIDDRVRTFQLMEIAGGMMNDPKPFAKIWR